MKEKNGREDKKHKIIFSIVVFYKKVKTSFLKFLLKNSNYFWLRFH